MRSPSPILLAGDDLDIDLITELLTMLPCTAYGQIIIEVPHLGCVQDLREPPGFTVHWLSRQDSVSAARPVRAPGALLIEAVTVWAAEWIPEAGPQEALPQLVWIGGARCPQVTALCQHLHRLHHRLHLHHAAPC